ncbi:1-deoxy-D-xylulose-5-phosphate reductoisomerase [Corynebacterium sp.]|uniref:1-deoxy-D-xylulose-5-phosphate reductoisomerase n=1 Tax=Corynebacterium sp. TaxID=1720 RepID=UPI002A91193C|nr:1-deoxy-D-xylulose-5-phosphate reductoisomerase [Corynebacterium sp.]MDY5786398.1 1-deoxy-D-xylulose-5-phosphate reductoisomerase [Corynebacterium sp.]
MKKIVILGSTGSIGTQAIEVIESNRDAFEVVGIAAGGRDPGHVIAQARAFGLGPEAVSVSDPEAARVVADALGGTVLNDPAELVRAQPADTVLNALVGSLGLASTLAVLETGATLALANKESLVAGGKLVVDKAAEGQLVPVDSEHSAMAQCLRSGDRGEVARFVLTASGGPFRGRTRAEMMEVTPEQAAAHPTWSMGQMNTLNSATLVNKGLELIEATLLFDVDAALIDVSVHPQSIIHSMVTFVDGATIAQASPPSMKMPIAHALAWPNRVADAQPALDFSSAMEWTFEPVDNAAFPAVDLARYAAQQGATVPAVYNAANEEAAAAFLAGRIAFPHIVDVVAEIVGEAASFACAPESFEAVVAVETEARARANEHINRLARG